MSNKEKLMDLTIRYLKLHYWLSLIILVAYFMLDLFNIVPSFSVAQGVGVIFERYSIVITIIAIPAALKLFSEILKKVTPTSSVDIAMKEYKKAFFIHLYIINAMTLMNILLYSISQNMNFFWLTVVLFIVYIFCKPSYPELEGLMKKKEPEKQSFIDEDKIQYEDGENT